jgi:penicillin-binding protein 2
LKQDFIKREYVELVREGMKQSCENGGVAWPFFNFKISKSKFSKKFKIDNHDFTEEVATGGAKFVRIKLGCKTGTAEVGGKETKSHAWITLFAPFYKPKIVVTVLVENSGEGSSVAGPIAKQIVSRYFESNK